MASRTAADLFIVGTSIDPHISAVVERLPSSVRTCRLDVDLFPRDSSLTIEISNGRSAITVETEHGRFDVSHPRVAWFRRFGKTTLDPALDPAFAKFAADEADHTIQAALHLCEPSVWINKFTSARTAASKPFQYRVAQQSGLEMPESSLITNSPTAISSWLAHSWPAVIKSISRPALTSEESPGGALFAYTNLLLSRDDTWREARFAPVQMQSYVESLHALRVTSLAGRHWCVEIRLADNDPSRRDWRVDQDGANYRISQLPEAIGRGLDRLLVRLDLEYAASDFLMTETGKVIFLESNPHGAWRWLESHLPSMDFTDYFASWIKHACIR